MTLFLLLPPNALALLNYKTLGETVRLSNTQPRHFWLKPRFVTWFFFTSDVFSFLLQAGGVALSTRDGMREVAKKTILCGLAVQLLFFGAFFLIAMYVRNCAYYVVAKGPHDVDGIQAKARLMRTILSTTLLLYGRSVYRVIEFAGGYGSKVYGTEWMFYAFDTVIIMICFAVYIQSYLGHHFNGRSAIAVRLRRL
ncbi:hypothetical protein FBU59_003375 [Linderina macrospora]|uniref:Uncharacterized protein n=1 Tax=Linderina macrospora TaxID=4868 RepID=A0ACC1J8H9_9FUNG|nr:hypothetical protein FBU59_003375 [Linderina macrospora]